MILTCALILSLSRGLAEPPAQIDPQVERACAAQIAALVKTVHVAPNKLFKKNVFGPSIDKKYLRLADELKELGQRIIPGAPPDQFLRKKVGENFDRTLELAHQTAAKPMRACVEYTTALSLEAARTCSEPPVPPATAEGCRERANATPAVQDKFKAWQLAQNTLIQK